MNVACAECRILIVKLNVLATLLLTYNIGLIKTTSHGGIDDIEWFDLFK
jgi:hypothetical protein